MRLDTTTDRTTDRDLLYRLLGLLDPKWISIEAAMLNEIQVHDQH